MIHGQEAQCPPFLHVFFKVILQLRHVEDANAIGDVGAVRDLYSLGHASRARAVVQAARGAFGVCRLDPFKLLGVGLGGEEFGPVPCPLLGFAGMGIQRGVVKAEAAALGESSLLGSLQGNRDTSIGGDQEGCTAVF